MNCLELKYVYLQESSIHPCRQESPLSSILHPSQVTQPFSKQRFWRSLAAAFRIAVLSSTSTARFNEG